MASIMTKRKNYVLHAPRHSNVIYNNNNNNNKNNNNNNNKTLHTLYK